MGIALAVSVSVALRAETHGAAVPALVNHATPAGRAQAPGGAAPRALSHVVHTAQHTPCARNNRQQLIVVSIEHQHEWACQHRRTVLSTPVTTGATSRPGDATPRGTFAVQGRNRDTTLTTAGAASYHVSYWIPFHLGVWGFHDASWQTMPFGSKGYVARGSHGCIHMPLAAIRWLFHWVHYGTPVRIV